ncbi:hypothetical protein M413DRAFT_446873 [Hebeloma cylindrosporum]|uniref:Uncharacterized protein n=1 Tax=Hebeloma cylindrosporum TaxID=76867 RepID=A0A0C2YFW2_HEBCY|nr:hypothetical protein M413DRAFT_446873 [Hebeloma cylindrosporum h7]
MDAWDRDVVLLVDALDQLYDAQPAVQDECLQAFCDIQNSNNVPIRSVIAAGTLSVLHLNPRGSTVSPFNVANHIQTPYFTVEEVKKLFDEFAHDYHITIDDAVVQDIWAKSNGHPAMVCLCGRAIFKNLQSLVDGDSILSDRSWQRFPAHNLYHAISAYNTFDSMLLSLARSEAAAAVTLLRFKFAGFLGDVTLVNDMDRKLAHLLTSEGVLLKPDSLQHSYCMASALMDGFIRNELIPRLFPNCPASAPPLEAGGKGIHVLGILVESLKTFDKDLMRCASFRSYKKPKVKVLDAPYGNVPRESVYDTELMRILSNWFGNGHEWSVTGQWHLQNDANKHEYSDIVLKKEDHPTIVLELLATEEPSFVQSHIEKTPERMELVSAEEAWVVHFTCEQDYHPIWQSDAELLQGVNVVHFAHDIDFTKAAMSARWKDRAGNTQQVDQKLIDLGAN